MRDIDDSKVHPRRHRSSPTLAAKGSWFPSGIVCRDSPRSNNVVEWGLVLSLGVLGLFAVGCYETMASLPDPPTVPTFGAILHPSIGSSSTPARALEADITATAQKEEEPAAASTPSFTTAKTTTKVAPSPPAHIPPSIWPVSTRNDTEFDTILHPGDGKTKMKVPKFWSPPVHGGGRMDRTTALSMGSCIDGSKVGNGDCPLHQRTIFVAIASYRDFQCRQTVESIFSRASHPERIRVAVVDQVAAGDPICNEPQHGDCTENPEQALCKYQSQVDVYTMEAALSIGPVFARHIGYRQYRGEYYATQSDAHVSYTQGWDEDIIQQWMATNNVSAYSGFVPLSSSTLQTS